MKRLLSAALLFVMLASLASPVAAQQRVDERHDAFAMFELKSRGASIDVVGIQIAELRNASGTNASYTLFRGRCLEGTTDPHAECMISSRGFRSGSLQPDEYEIDPLLQKASVDFTRRGATHEVSWSSSAPSTPTAGETYCESGEPSAAAGGGFNAVAKGMIAGKKVETSLAGINAYAFISACQE